VMTQLQQRVAEELLGVGQPRPDPAPRTERLLRERISAATERAAALVGDGPKLVITKRSLAGLSTCEQMHIAERDQPWPDRLPDAVALGLLIHRALVIVHNSPGLPAGEYVAEADLVLRRERNDYLLWARTASIATTAETSAAATNAVATFILDWPAMPSGWQPLFEPTVRATVGPLVLSARPDLVLGVPRPSAVPTMAVVDFKTGQLRDSHRAEAMFYAAAATLRWRVPPARSFCFSLSSGASTFPTAVTTDDLVAAADNIAHAANRLAELTLADATPTRTPSRACDWCPVREDCQERLAHEGATPEHQFVMGGDS